MKKLLELIKKYVFILFTKIVRCVKIYIVSETSLYSVNAAFFLIVTCIPLFMLLFSSLSLIPNVTVDDLINNMNTLFPDLPYLKTVITKIFEIANSLATKNIISINVVLAIIAGSTTLYSFTIGIRKIHNITGSIGYIKLRLLSVFNMFVFFAAVLIMLILFLLGNMILEYVSMYLPFADPVIDQILSFKYLVSIIVLISLMLSIYCTSTNFERKPTQNLIGAIVATIAWLLISNLFSIYFNLFPLNASIYGSLTGIILVLLWVLVCMNLIFIGAIINEVFIPQRKILEKKKEEIIKELASN